MEQEKTVFKLINYMEREELEKITTGNALLVSQRDYDFFLDAVSMYNKFNGSTIGVALVHKNEDSGDMLFKIIGISMLSDVLEIGKRMQVLKITRG